MSSRSDKLPYLSLLLSGIAAILLSSTGVAHMMGWGPNLADDSDRLLALDILPVAQAQPVAVTAEQAAGNARARGRCAECGMIVSVRQIETHVKGAGHGATAARASDQGELPAPSIGHYEITVRLADGSSRVINDANPASWRPGERLIVIGGAGGWPAPQGSSSNLARR